MKQFKFKTSGNIAAIAMAAIVLVMGSHTPSWADCFTPSAVAGTQMYNATYNVMQYCNGTSWISMDGHYSGIAGPEPDNLGTTGATKDLNMGGFKVQELAPPTAGTDAATKVYVDTKTGAAEADPQAGTLTNNKLCKGNGTAVQCTFDPPANQLMKTFIAVDEKADGTNAGASSTTWATRTLNTVKYNDLGASLAGNQITLPPGTYYVDAVIPFMRSGPFKSRLYNVTAAASAIAGTSGQNATPASEGGLMSASFIRGVIGITATSVFRIEYFSEATSGDFSTGQNVPAAGTEIYTTITISRIASASTVTPTQAPCAGARIGDQCWYLGAVNQSCDTVCATHNGCSDIVVSGYTGNAGSNANCVTVMTALGSAGAVTDSTATTSNYELLGCNIRGGTKYRYTAATTTCGDAESTSRRACPCAN